MSFGNPLALIAGLLIVLVVGMYRHRMRLRREVMATDFFWEQVFAEEPFRMAWQKYRHGFSLALEVAVMALLALALAEPLVPGPQQTVLVIDNSASMNAGDVDVPGTDKPSRLAEAKQTALEMVEALRDCDRMAVLSTGDAVGVASILTGDKPTLREAVRSIRPTKGTTEAAAAVRLAGRMLADRPGEPDAEGVSTEAIFHGPRRFGQNIVLLSDGRFDAAEQLASVDGVRLVRIGKPTGNAAIARFEARRNLADPRRCQVLVEVRSFSDQPIQCPLAISTGDRVIDRIPLALAKDGRWQGVFEMLSGSGTLLARLELDDRYPLDNVAAVEVPPAGVHEVVLVTQGNHYLQSVLQAARETIHLTIARQSPANLPPGTILVFDGAAPNPLPKGPVLVIGPANATDLWELGEPLEDVTVATQDAESPLMADVRLTGVRLTGARQIRTTGQAAARAKSAAGNAAGAPLVLAIDRPEGRVVVLGGDLLAGSLPLRTIFPILIGNALDWLAGIDRGARPAASPADRPLFAESDIRVPANLGVDPSEMTAPRHGLPPWLYLAVVAAVLLGIEWCLYQRRWVT